MVQLGTVSGNSRLCFVLLLLCLAMVPQNVVYPPTSMTSCSLTDLAKGGGLFECNALCQTIVSCGRLAQVDI